VVVVVVAVAASPEAVVVGSPEVVGEGSSEVAVSAFTTAPAAGGARVMVVGSVHTIESRKIVRSTFRKSPNTALLWGAVLRFD
jgi:hypothetical protein